MKRLPLVLAVAAFLLALLGVTPLGEAAKKAPPSANETGQSARPLPPIVFRNEHVCSSGRLGDCGRGEIALVKFAGSVVQRLTHNRVTEQLPAWSPDHKWIAYVRGGFASGPPRIWLMKADGSHQHLLSRDAARAERQSGRPAWSPDGRRIAASVYDPVTRYWSLYVFNVRTGRRTALSFDPPDPYVGGPTWSPDGRSLAFYAQRARGSFQIFVLDLRQGRVRQLTHCTEDGCVYPDWSRDGRIAYSDFYGGIYVMNPNGSGRRKLYTGLVNVVRGPKWSPDGRWIVFEQGDIYAIRSNGSALHRITHARSGWVNTEPDW